MAKPFFTTRISNRTNPDSHEIPDAKRVRKLLLHRQEIDKLYGETQVKGRALIVLKLYWKNGKLKAELGVGHGKEARDKRTDLKKRAVDRETARDSCAFQPETRIIISKSDGCRSGRCSYVPSCCEAYSA